MATGAVDPSDPFDGVYCDFCLLVGVQTEATHDAAMRWGGWAKVCEAHFTAHRAPMGEFSRISREGERE